MVRTGPKLSAATSEWGEKATAELLELSPQPTALYAASNALMPGGIKAIRRRRVRVPDAMSLVCFDDVDWFSFSQPPITAIRTSHSALAETAVRLLLSRIESPDWRNETPAFIESPFELVIRGSTAPPKAAGPN